MTKFAILFAAAGLLLATPTFTAPAAAQDVQLRIGTGDGPRVHRSNRVYRSDRGYRAYGYRNRDNCRTTVVIKDGRKTVIKRCR